MDKLHIQQSAWEDKLCVGKTKLTVHNVSICSDLNDISYTTSAVGVVHNVHTECDDKYDTVSIVLEVRIFPFDKAIREHLPLFKNMLPDTEHLDRTIFADDDGTIYVRVSHEIQLEDDDFWDPNSFLNIPGVFMGVKCRRKDCYIECYKHGIRQPYIYQRV